MKKLSLITPLLFFSALSLSAKDRKTVFVVVDGIPADVIERVATPAIDEIAFKGGYARMRMGGIIDGYSQTPTISAVGYNCLLTGTWANKHNVFDNGIANPNYNYWSIFRIAESQKKEVKTAVYSTWLDNRTKLIGEALPQNGNFSMDHFFDGMENDPVNYPAEDEHMNIFKIDEAVSLAASKGILTDAPDLTWVYLQYTDDAGHLFGDGDKFDQYVKKADEQVSRIWESVKIREAKYDEEWMMIVVTDHGRNASGHGHGGQTDRERTVWMATNIGTNRYFKNPDMAITDIAPSIARYMDFDVPNALRMESDGIPFIGNASICGLDASLRNDEVVLTWEALEPKSKVTVYASMEDQFKNGGSDTWVKLGTAKASEGCFRFKQMKKPSGFYKFSLISEGNAVNCQLHLD